MNVKLPVFLRNLTYSLSSNLISFLISVIVILVVPKALGIEEYGYWHLYLFYTSYTALLHFGWTDGVYLRYGGKEYKELDKKLFFSQFWMLVLFEFIITLCIIIISDIFINNTDRLFILKMIVLSSLIVIPSSMLLFLLQGTNRIKEYTTATLVGRVMYCLLILLFITVGTKSYQMIIMADIVGRFLTLSYSVYYCKDIVFKRIASFFLCFGETAENIRVGIKISLAYVASTLIIGAVRFGIEYTWDIETFGKVSLTLSISNLMMVFINAVGLVMFPMLRRIDEFKLPSLYRTIRTLLTVPLLGFLVAYYPIKTVISTWLPQYSETLAYMAILFPIVLFEGKMALLINTYLKTLRKEKLILIINLLSLSLSLALTLLFIIVLQNLTLSIILIVVVLAFRCVLAEILLARILKITLSLDIILEIGMTTVFILIAWFNGSWTGVCTYLLVYLFYILIKFKDTVKAINNLRTIIKA